MRYIHGDISHFLYKVIKRGEMMTEIMCCKSKCLNNKNGQCTASEVYYDGLCQTYCTSKHAAKQVAGICARSHGRMKAKDNNILK